MLCAVERGIILLVSPRSDRRLRVVDADRPALPLDTTIDPGGQASSAGHWTTYPLTVARRVSLNFPGELRGADIAFASDLPLAAGMSSSSALVVAVFLALARVNDLTAHPAYRRAIRSPEDLAGYLGAVENGRTFGDLEGSAGVGTFGGSEDHTAILCGRPNALVEYSFCPVRFRRSIPLPNNHEFVIASSGIVAEKSGAARDQYNRASLATQQLLTFWNDLSGRRDDTLAEAVESSPDAVARMTSALAQNPDAEESTWLRARLAQFALENTHLIPDAGDALERGDLRALGDTVDRSQSAAEALLGNQTAETMWLAREARSLGAAAASAFGAGFGGSVWALVPSENADWFRATWAERYERRFPRRAGASGFFRTHAGPHAAPLVAPLGKHSARDGG